jgi:hypothetical protein
VVSSTQGGGHRAVSQGRPTARVYRRRQATAAAILLAVLLAFAGGYILGHGGRKEPPAASGPSGRPSPSHTRSPRPTVTPTPTVTSSPTPSPEPSQVLPDGRSFVYAKKVVGSTGAQSLTFDLALFLTDQAAVDAAAAHGDETPPPNGYYIVNDNPLLRTIAISPAVSIRYFPTSGPGCCSHKPGTLDGFSAAVNGTATTDFPDMRYAPWWITLQNGVIVSISQQYLP